MAKVIARHQENISLNDYEYILNENNEVMKFDTDEQAVDYLNKHSDKPFTKEEWDEQGVYIFDDENRYLCNKCGGGFLAEEMDFDEDNESDLCKNCTHISFNDAPYGEKEEE